MGQPISKYFGGIIIMKLAEGESIPGPNMFCQAVSLNTVKCDWQEGPMTIGRISPLTFKQPIKDKLELEWPGLVYVIVPWFVGSDEARKLIEVEEY